MTAECDRWTELLKDLLTNPEDPELLRLAPQECDALLLHAIDCTACEANDALDALDGMPEAVAAKVFVAIETFLKGVVPDEVKTAAVLRIDDLVAEAAKANAEIEAAVRDFIALHPQLEPPRWGIATDEHVYLKLFIAVDALNLLLKHAVGRQQQPQAYGLREDGEIFLQGKTLIPPEGVVAEFGRWLEDCDRDTRGRLVRWVFEAIRCKPDLLHDYLLTGFHPGTPRIMTLSYLPTKSDRRNQFDCWRETTVPAP